MHRFGRRGRTCVLALAVLAGAAGCDSADDDPTPAVEIDATTYVAAIAGYLPRPGDPEQRAVVYVVPVGDESLPLGTQVAVIEALADRYDVRFVDQADAAVDEGTADEPPRDDGTLIGLGTVTETPPHTVRIEVYADRERVEAHLVTVAVRRGHWEVLDDEPVEPEVLIGGE